MAKGKWQDDIQKRSTRLLMCRMNHELLADKCKAEGDGEGEEYHKNVSEMYADELGFLIKLVRDHSSQKVYDAYNKELWQNRIDFMRTHIDYVYDAKVKRGWINILKELGYRQFIGLPLTYLVGGMRGNYHGQ